MSESERHRAREALVQALYQWDYNPAPAPELEMELLDEGYLEGAERGYFQELLRRVIDRCGELDGHLEPALGKRRLSEVTAIERAILRLGAAELAFRPDVPRGVVINEAIELAKAFGTTEGYRFVNGVLDRIAPDLRPAEPARGHDG
jgi:N utilization substance protein B